MRLAQWDILEFSRDPKHTSPDWPSGYWPKTQAPPNSTAPIPHGKGQTILREALLIASHNAYQLGELVLVRRLLGAWK